MPLHAKGMSVILWIPSKNASRILWCVNTEYTNHEAKFFTEITNIVVIFKFSIQGRKNRVW